MKRIFNILTVVLFCGFIFLVPIMTKIQKPVTYSPFENRNMAAPPVFETEKLLKGQYLPQWDTYFADQIWQRNWILETFTALSLNILQKPVVRNVVVQQGVLLPFIEYSNVQTDYTQAANDMTYRMSVLDQKVSQYGGKFLYVGIPEQMTAMKNSYPSYLNDGDKDISLREKTFFDSLKAYGIDYLNMRDEFIKEDDYERFYSITDHHYNLYGAHFTYSKIMDSLGVEKVTDLTFEKLANPFYGSRNRKLYNAYNSEENLYYYVANEPINFVRSDNSKSSNATVFFLPTDSTSPVTYDMYMGGDIAETIIDTGRSSLPSILIFGDSFTNPLETFVYLSFDKMISVDLRHNKASLLEYIDEYKPDYVICVRDNLSYLLLEGNGNIYGSEK